MRILLLEMGVVIFSHFNLFWRFASVLKLLSVKNGLGNIVEDTSVYILSTIANVSRSSCVEERLSGPFSE